MDPAYPGIYYSCDWSDRQVVNEWIISYVKARSPLERGGRTKIGDDITDTDNPINSTRTMISSLYRLRLRRSDREVPTELVGTVLPSRAAAITSAGRSI